MHRSLPSFLIGITLHSKHQPFTHVESLCIYEHCADMPETAIVNSWLSSQDISHLHAALIIGCHHLPHVVNELTQSLGHCHIPSSVFTWLHSLYIRSITSHETSTPRHKVSSWSHQGEAALDYSFLSTTQSPSQNPHAPAQ